VSNSPLPSIIISFTLARDEKVDHYTRIKIHKLVILKFWIESDVNVLCSWAQVSLVLYPQWNSLCKPNKWYQSRLLKLTQTSADLYRPNKITIWKCKMFK